MRKRIVASVLSLCMALALTSTSVLAVESIPKTVVEESISDSGTDLPETEEAEGDDLQETEKEDSTSGDEDDADDNPDEIENEAENPDNEENSNNNDQEDNNNVGSDEDKEIVFDEVEDSEEASDKLEEVIPENAVLDVDAEAADDKISIMSIEASGTCGENLTWKLVDGTLTINGTGEMANYKSPGYETVAPWSVYRSSIETIIISDGVTDIGDYVFYDCSSLTEITIPDSVTSIGNGAFAYCYELANIFIPDSVTEIESFAFRGCSSLNDFSLPTSLIKIGQDAFNGCSNLRSVVIPEGVTTIRPAAFKNCSSLASVMIPDSVVNTVYGGNGTGIFQGCTSLTSAGPLGGDYALQFGHTDRIPEALFMGSSIKSVIIPDSMTSIGNSAFRECSSLASIIIPKSVKYMDFDVFKDCISLTSAGPIGGNYNIQFGWDTEIPSLAFSRSEVVTAVIPDGITEIGYDAFRDCSNLSSVIIPNSAYFEVDISGNDVGMFSGCSSLTSAGPIGGNYNIQFGWDTEIPTRAFYNSDVVTVTIPDGVTVINGQAFSLCDNLTDVDLPDSVRKIGDNAFCGCVGLTNIELPDKVISLGRDVFCDCTGLISVIIAGSVKISDYDGWSTGLFSGCTGLTSAGPIGGNYNIQYGWKSEIPSGVFYGSEITDIMIPKEIVKIQSKAFFGCEELSDVYYVGSKNDWNSISIAEGNEYLINATIHYNSSGMGSGGGDEDDSGNTPVKPPVKPPVSQGDPTLIVKGRDFDFTDPGSVQLVWGWNWILNRKSTDYMHDVATVALALSAAAERSQNDIESMLAGDNFGVDAGLTKSGNYNNFTINNPAYTFAHKTIDNGGKTEHIITIVVRGTTPGSGDIWTDYNSITDNFRITANNIWLSFAEWLNEKEVEGEKLTSAISNGNVKFFVTGHSLGGAVANRIAYRLNQVYGSENVYAYTFASPPTEGQTSTYAPNIFNVLCKGDPVPYLGVFTDGRYGNDLWFADSCRIPAGFPYIGFLDNHVVESYMKHLLNISNYRTAMKSGRVHCPTDLKIYNSSGQLVGSVTNNTIDEENMTDSVLIVLSGEDNDEKNFYFLTDDTYTLEFTGTDNGTLTYTIRDTYADKTKIIEKVYANVKLFDGKKMTSIVSVWDIDDTSVDVSDLVATPDVELLVLDDNGKAIYKVLDDGNGTEVPVNGTEESGGSNESGGLGKNSTSNATSSWQTSNRIDISGGTNTGTVVNVEIWKPTTPDEKKRYACVGKDAVQYTLPNDNAYRIVIENAMQGPLCFKSFEAVLGHYTIGRTYNVYTLPNSVYSKDKEIQFTIKIPSDIYKKDREYKMICVTKGGLPIIYNDVDTNPETITVRTNRFYAYALIYK